ncbi:hypothetical protein [Nitratireductor sp. OM-1]|uniref:hypothetical protein n=1 Tax=Nitratireductor sp. OM-1 TaxID=1756988 RepID=UPI0013AF71F0|nr:hypothetical protein [Nitratireductor sp. OM-1]
MKVKFEVINCDCSDALPIGLGVIERAMPGERLGSTWSATGAIERRYPLGVVRMVGMARRP